MFIRKRCVNGSTYLSLVHSVRTGNTVKHIHIANLGNVEKCREKLLALGTKLLLECGAKNIPVGDVLVPKANEYGKILILNKLFEECGLHGWLSAKISSSKKPYVSLPHIKAMIFNRVCDPRSKYSILRWLEDIAFDEIELPEVVNDEEQKRFAEVFYQNMDFLLPLKDNLELFLYDRVKTLFDVEVDVVLYDLTSTYFEGDGPAKLGARGYSRDEKPRNPQIVVGVVLADGFPIAHEIFKGNTPDRQTLETIINSLTKRFKIKRVVFVADSGILTQDNIEFLEKKKYEYVIGCRRRRSEPWWEIFSDWEKEAKEMPGREEGKRLWWVEKIKEKRRVVLCHSEHREYFERGIREGISEKIRTQLEKLEKRVRKGKLKDVNKIIVSAERILSKKRAKRYFEYIAKAGSFTWRQKEASVKQEQFLEGKFLLITNNKDMKAPAIIMAYKDLLEIESTFRQLKDFIRVRPIFHWKDDRVKAHVLISVLGHFLEKMLQRKLQDAKMKMTARRALDSVRTVKLAHVKIGEQILKRITKPGPVQQGILQATLGPDFARM